MVTNVSTAEAERERILQEVDEAIASPMSLQDALEWLEELQGAIDTRIEGIKADLGES
jgi:hypothetical protein